MDTQEDTGKKQEVQEVPSPKGLGEGFALEVGKTYITRHGMHMKIELEEAGSTLYPFMAKINGWGEFWYGRGGVLAGYRAGDAWDLVAPAKDESGED